MINIIVGLIGVAVGLIFSKLIVQLFETIFWILYGIVATFSFTRFSLSCYNMTGNKIEIFKFLKHICKFYREYVFSPYVVHYICNDGYSYWKGINCWKVYPSLKQRIKK